nr:hypothetical protein [Tanacetum cinerariifolium]
GGAAAEYATAIIEPHAHRAATCGIGGEQVQVAVAVEVAYYYALGVYARGRVRAATECARAPRGRRGKLHHPRRGLAAACRTRGPCHRGLHRLTGLESVSGRKAHRAAAGRGAAAVPRAQAPALGAEHLEGRSATARHGLVEGRRY